VAGLKATSSGRSLKSRIFGDFTRKISKNGHFWGLAKMARPPTGARPSVNRGGCILNRKAYIANALYFFARWGPCRGSTIYEVLIHLRAAAEIGKSEVHRGGDGRSQLKAVLLTLKA
jgi:hypothetical protein